MKLFGKKAEELQKELQKELKEELEEEFETQKLKALESLALPDSSVDTSGSEVLRSAETVIFPLYTCIKYLRQINPQVNDIPDLFELSSNNLLLAGGHKGLIGGIGSICGGLVQGITAYHNTYQDSEVETDLFDIYCKCRQILEASKDFISQEEKAVLQSIVDRAEGDNYQDKYEALRNPQTVVQETDNEVKALVLPEDYLTNIEYFDPAASIIGTLPEKVLKGGGARFAIMIEVLASNSFGYIRPTIGNKRLLAARLSGCKQETTYSKVQWIDKKGRSVSETEKVMLWLTNYLYGGGKYLSGGGYDRAYEVLNFERHVKPGQETANLKNADKVLRDRISLLYLNV